MKRLVCLFGIIILFSCTNDTAHKSIPSEKILSHYKQFSRYTDPGKFAYMFKDLPESLPKLCSLIKRQLIHPVDLGELRKSLPEERHFEDPYYPTVQAMLERLLHYDQRGFTPERRPVDRLIVACYNHALLLTSILRQRGIPVRIRAGFARYFEKKAGVRFGHAICEVWDNKEKRWMLVDPDRQFVDFSWNRFESSASAWERLRAGKADPERYVASLSKGDHAILHILLLDLACVLGEERPYWQEPPILRHEISDVKNIDSERLQILDQVAELLSDPDANFSQLSLLYDKHKFLQKTELDFDTWFNERQVPGKK